MPVVATPAATAGVLLELDPASESTGTPLILADGEQTHLLQWDFPEPEEDPLSVESRDMEGSRPVHNRHKARTGTIVLRAIGIGAAPHEACDAIVTAIEHKVQKIRAEGGTLKATVPSGKEFVLDLHSGGQAVTLDKRWVDNARCQITLTFGARPYWRNEPIQLADHSETNLGVCIFTESGIKGSVPGDIKIVVDDDDGEAQRLVILGIQSRHYSADATAALHYECESRTALGGSATAAGPAGASGSGSNVMRQTGLFTAPQAIMSTQGPGGGAHLSHVGGFRWWQRLYVPVSNGGTVTVALEWGAGDFQRTEQNAPVVLPSAALGTWVLVDLGTVQLSKVTQGTQQWEGRVMASSTSPGDDIDLDRFLLVPYDEGYCEVGAPYFYRPGVIVARDAFTGRTAGAALNGTSAALGGTWSTSGATTDFIAADNVPETGDETVTRSTSSDAHPGRQALAGATTYTDAEAGVDFYSTPDTGAPRHQVVVRYVDASNFLRAEVSATNQQLLIRQRVAGVDTLLGVADTSNVRLAWHTVRVVAFASGHCRAQLLKGNSIIAEVAGTSAELATGGALATGKVGFGDYNPISTVARHYRDFYGAVPPAEPLSIAPNRSLEIRSNGAGRQDAGGTLWVDVPIEGFYPRVPPAWLEGRAARFLVANCRGPKLATAVYADGGIDDLSARVTYVPRTLNLPEA